MLSEPLPCSQQPSLPGEPSWTEPALSQLSQRLRCHCPTFLVIVPQGETSGSIQLIIAFVTTNEAQLQFRHSI